MNVPPEILFHGMDRSQWVEDYVRERLEHLERFAEGIVSAHVTLTRTQSSHHSGNEHSVMVQVRLPPNHDLAARKERNVGDTQTQLRPLIRSAFEAVERQLKEVAQRRRHEVKTHDAPPVSGEEPQRGLVDRIDAEGYGFIRTLPDNREIYFHRNSVLHDDFDRLSVGTEVRFEAEEGDKGPQATSVQMLGRPGVRADRMSGQQGPHAS